MREIIYEKILPNEIPIVRTQPFWQIHNEGLGQYARYVHPFLTTVSGGQHLSVEGYRYLSILTDGGINPLNNYLPATSGHSELFLRYDDGERIDIMSEIRDLPIPKGKSYIDLYNQLGAGQGATEGIETGYSNLWLIKSKYPLNMYMKKHNPAFCMQKELAADSTWYSWIGVDRLNAAWDLLLPYIPMGYAYINVCFNTFGGTLGGSTFGQYGLSICTFPVRADYYWCNTSISAGCQMKYMCSDRGRFVFINSHAENTMDVHLQGFLTMKADYT